MISFSKHDGSTPTPQGIQKGKVVHPTAPSSFVYYLYSTAQENREESKLWNQTDEVPFCLSNLKVIPLLYSGLYHFKKKSVVVRIFVILYKVSFSFWLFNYTFYFQVTVGSSAMYYCKE